MPFESWYTGRVSCYIWYSDDGTERGRSLPRSLLTIPNVLAHPSTAGVPVTVFLYNGPLLCGFDVVFKGLIPLPSSTVFVERNSERIIEIGLHLLTLS